MEPDFDFLLIFRFFVTLRKIQKMEINLNFEYIGAHLIDYIENENFFDTFEIDDIRTIMKYSHLTADQFITLLKKAHSAINARKLYTCTRKANVTIKNIEEAVSILKSVKKYMKFNILLVSLIY